MADDETHFGFKRLSVGNWLTPDDAAVYQVRDPQAWIDAVYDAKLITAVPEEIKALTEVARGALVYGYLFYPLITLGTDQVFRVLEAAVRIKCEQLKISTETVKPNGQSSPVPYATLIRTLSDRGVIPAADMQRWLAGKDLRNMSSHPSRQWIINPGQALTMLRTTVEEINGLFADVEPQQNRAV